MRAAKLRVHDADDAGPSLEYLVDSIDLVAPSLWEAVQRAGARRCTTITMTLEEAAILLTGLEAALELGRRA